MKILVTGGGGFVGSNLIAELRNRGYTNILEFRRNDSLSVLDEYCKEAEFVFHLAGVNRPQHESEFMEGNYELTSLLLEKLKLHNNASPVLLSSSIQANRDNAYGISKRKSEELVFAHGRSSHNAVYVYRLPNIFGKWCRPNYNSAVATFCYNIARDLAVTVHDPDVELSLAYIDDVVAEFIQVLENKGEGSAIYEEVSSVYTVRLQHIVDLLYSFRNSRRERAIPNMSDEFTKKLYSTYLSYLPVDQFAYDLKMNVDSRGSFTEFIRTPDRGQVSVNISRPGITKGNHWHHTKNEKFLVVSGTGIIRFRRPGTEEVLEYFVSGEQLRVVDIPPGYTHNIENLGEADMVTIMWVNEPFDPRRPDTYVMEV